MFWTLVAFSYCCMGRKRTRRADAMPVSVCGSSRVRACMSERIDRSNQQQALVLVSRLNRPTHRFDRSNSMVDPPNRSTVSMGRLDRPRAAARSCVRRSAASKQAKRLTVANGSRAMLPSSLGRRCVSACALPSIDGGGPAHTDLSSAELTHNTNKQAGRAAKGDYIGLVRTPCACVRPPSLQRAAAESSIAGAVSGGGVRGGYYARIRSPPPAAAKANR